MLHSDCGGGDGFEAIEAGVPGATVLFRDRPDGRSWSGPVSAPHCAALVSTMLILLFVTNVLTGAWSGV